MSASWTLAAAAAAIVALATEKSVRDLGAIVGSTGWRLDLVLIAASLAIAVVETVIVRRVGALAEATVRAVAQTEARA